MYRGLKETHSGPSAVSEWVWYTGDDALRVGEAVCYDITSGDAALRAGGRHKNVARPSITNAGAFAGVLANNYKASSTGQFVEIYVPGSKGVEIALGANTTLNSGILTFALGAGTNGRFIKAGFAGRGSAAIRQTVSDAVLESSYDSTWTVAVSGTVINVADGTKFKAGDTIHIVSGEDSGANKLVVPGVYTVTGVNANAVSINRSAVKATPSAALGACGFAIRGNPTCQADLLDGEESGGIEFVMAPNTGTNTSMTYSPVGKTYIVGAVTIGTADANGALGSGTIYGQKKAFECLAAQTTKTVKVTLTGLQRVVNTTSGAELALASLKFATANTGVVLEWRGTWQTLFITDNVTAASK
jgi:hypothetical protein